MKVEVKVCGHKDSCWGYLGVVLEHKEASWRSSVQHTALSPSKTLCVRH